MLGMDAGALDRRVTIERFTETEDPGGRPVQAWAPLTTRWASVSFGRGEERRQAAQESASAPATFRMRWDSVTKTITPADRLSFLDATWDITSAVPFGRNAFVDVTAVRAS